MSVNEHPMPMWLSTMKPPPYVKMQDFNLNGIFQHLNAYIQFSSTSLTNIHSFGLSLNFASAFACALK